MSASAGRLVGVRASVRLLGALAAASLAATSTLASSARAEEVSSAELRALAARAAHDPAALERLRGVDRVDGRPARLATALEGAQAQELAARLRALAAAPSGPAARRGDARAQAREIVAGRRFSQPRLPGPFRGLLHRVADWLAPVIALIPTLDDLLPGGRPVVWALIVLVVGGAAAALAGRTLRRRTAAGAPRATPGVAAIADDAATLEHRAREAAALGEHELALRLGFRAGLARLDDRGMIELRPSLANEDVARALRSPDFDRLALRFDEVAYGGRRAAAADLAAARTDWDAVLSRDRPSHAAAMIGGSGSTGGRAG